MISKNQTITGAPYYPLPGRRLVVSNNGGRVHNNTLSKADSVPAILRIVTYLFVFTVPWEGLYFGAFSNKFTFTKAMGYLLLLLFFFFKGRDIFKVSKTVKVFLLFFSVYFSHALIMSVFGDDYVFSTIIGSVFTIFQLLIFFIVIHRLSKDFRVYRGIINSLLIGYSSLAFVIVINIETLVQKIQLEGGAVVRYFAVSQDPNNLASYFAITACVIIAIIITKRTTSFDRYNIIRWIAVYLLLTAIMLTGSRGGSVVLMLGILTNIFLSINLKKSVRLLLVVFSTSILLYSIVTLFGETVIHRFRNVIEREQPITRVEIAKESVYLLLENPIFGVGPVEYASALGSRLGTASKSSHNTYLRVLLETGIIGFIPFILGIGMTLKMAYANRTNRFGIIMLVFLVTLLVSFLFLEWTHRKITWIILGLATNTSLHAYLSQKTVAKKPSLNAVKYS